MTVEEFLKEINIDLPYTLYDEYEIYYDETPRYIDSSLKTKILSIDIDDKLKQIILNRKGK